MIRKFSPIISKWHRNWNSEQSEIILSMDNCQPKNMEEEKLKNIPLRSYAEGSWQQSSLY